MKLIKINTDHYIIVDDSEIKEGDWVYQPMTNAVYKTSRTDNSDIGYKITHSTEPLDKSSFFTDRVWGCERLSLGDVKELIGEVDVEKMAKKDAIEVFGNDFSLASLAHQTQFKRGYYQALEDNKGKKYTLEDMLNAHYIGWIDRGESRNVEYPKARNLFKLSLQPKTEWEVEFDENGKLILV